VPAAVFVRYLSDTEPSPERPDSDLLRRVAMYDLVVAALAAAFVLTSPVFQPGSTIPTRYSCDGANVSPPLRWTAPPRGTAWLSLTVFDPDAPGGGFLHWLIRRLPATMRTLPAGSHLGGPNGAGRSGYTGPCPPSGPAHHYQFVLRALSASGKVLAVARLVGIYRR
jgi:Raf kinase inhibitor-like YbhB/YbcL family protein